LGGPEARLARGGAPGKEEEWVSCEPQKRRLSLKQRKWKVKCPELVQKKKLLRNQHQGNRRSLLKNWQPGGGETGEGPTSGTVRENNNQEKKEKEHAKNYRSLDRKTEVREVGTQNTNCL